MADIDVFQTVTSVSFEVEPNTNVININKITTTGYSGVPSLQDVTDVGASTTNPITANSFIKSGGTGANVLLDNGSTTPLTSIVGTTNLTYTSGVSNGVVNSNTGTDATIPLADGTNAGLFSATEKTKLSGIASGAEVNVNADWNAISGDAEILNKPTGLATTTYVDNKDNSQQLQLNYLDRDNSIFDAFYLRTITDGGTVEASNQLLSSLAVLRNISYVNQGYTQQINADKFVKLGGAADEYLMADGSVSFGGGGGGGATNLTTTQTISNFTINSNTGTDATVPLGNGTLAGATLNDYTTAEKTKLSGIQAGANLGVPYTGATSDVNLGEFGIQLGNLEFDNTPTNTPTTAGSVYYNDADGTLDLILKGGNVTLQIGQETVIRVVNKTATSISLLQSDYQAVRITGAQGQRPKVDLAQATNDVLSAETIGLVTETIANNQEGFITTSGLVRGINTTGSLQGETWLDGDILYLSPTVAGSITKVKPIAPNHLIIIGYVISAHITQGTIFVKVDNGYELDELHNVKIATPANNSVLAYTLATDIWENKTVETALGYTPYNATNPSGYQTASQVQTIADAKVANTITNGVTTSAPNQDVVFDALALKANDANVVHLTGSETIGGVKFFNDNILLGGTIEISDEGGSANVLFATDGTYYDINNKQDTLVSTTNIKSINGNSILGSGNLVIPTAQTGTIIVTSGTSFTTPSTITTSTVFIIQLVGGGGGGGGGPLGTSSSASGAGAGGYVFERITGLSASTTYTCAIGTGGTGGAAQTGGTSGTSTTLTIGAATFTASGGGFGTAAQSAAGGAGGTGSATGVTPDIVISGQNGGDSLTTAASVPSGIGGSSPKGWGLGGSGVLANKNGYNATGYGAGGSGGKGVAASGGNGTQGIIYCQYFN